MTIDEAIKLIQSDIDDQEVDWDTPLGGAYKLSLEALKFIKGLHDTGAMPSNARLLGETKD